MTALVFCTFSHIGGVCGGLSPQKLTPLQVFDADGSRVSIALIRLCDSVFLCVILSVCLSPR